MVLDDLSDRERYGVAGAFAAAVVVSLAVGFGAASVMDEGFTGQELSEDDVETLAQTLMDQDVAQQEAQLSTVAEQNENISEEDISVNAEVQQVSTADFASLYQAEIAVEGNVPNQEGEIESMTEEQDLYFSKDGRYLFQAPIDLEAQQQQAAQPEPGAEEPQPAPEQEPEDLEDELDEEVVIE